MSTERKIDRYFFGCECGHAIVEVDKWAEELPPKVHLAFYELGLNKNNNQGWKERLRHAWHIIKTGRPFADSIILSDTDAKSLGEKLIEVSK